MLVEGEVEVEAAAEGEGEKERELMRKEAKFEQVEHEMCICVAAR